MRSASNISVLRHIVHITDKKGNQLRLAESDTLMDDDMKNYFVSHIETSLAKATTRAARFCNPDNPETGGLCRGLICGDVEFVEGSKRLATRLFEKMDRRSASGGFAVILFEADVSQRGGNSQRRPLLALLKMDVGNHYVTEFDEETQSTRLRKQENTLPSKNDGLQKCAFVWREDRDPDNSQHYDLMLLDDQSSGSSMDVARFFQTDFLDAEFVFNSRRQATLFVSAALHVVDQAAEQGHLEEEKKMELRDAIYAGLARPFLDIPVWAQELPADEESRNFIEAQLRGELKDLAFQPEQIKKPRRVVFRGEDDLEVKIREELVNRVMPQTPTPIRDADGSIYYEIVLRTREWRTKK